MTSYFYHQVVAVAARSLDSAKKFAQVHDIPKFYDSYEQLAKDDNVQVVYIGSINPEHFRLGKLMLENGKHLLIEKPLTMSLMSTTQLVNLARSKNLFLMEALWSRFLPAYLFLDEQLKLKSIGNVFDVTTSFGIPIAEVDRVGKRDLGGGVIYDIGIYALNAILTAYDDEKPTQVKALGHLNREKVDESISASLTFSNGKTASFTIHSRVQLPNETVISGTNGFIKLPSPMWCTDTVTVGVNGQEPVVHKFPFPETVIPCVYDNSSGLRYQAMEVRRCINEGKIESDRMSHEISKLIASLQDDLRNQVGYTNIVEKQ